MYAPHIPRPLNSTTLLCWHFFITFPIFFMLTNIHNQYNGGCIVLSRVCVITVAHFFQLASIFNCQFQDFLSLHFPSLRSSRSCPSGVVFVVLSFWNKCTYTSEGSDILIIPDKTHLHCFRFMNS